MVKTFFKYFLDVHDSGNIHGAFEVPHDTRQRSNSPEREWCDDRAGTSEVDQHRGRGGLNDESEV